MSEVKSKSVWRHQRTALLDMFSQAAAKRCMEQMRTGVISRNISPSCCVYFSECLFSGLRCAFDHFTDMHNQSAHRPSGIFNLNRPTVTADRSRVADLSAGFNI